MFAQPFSLHQRLAWAGALVVGLGLAGCATGPKPSGPTSSGTAGSSSVDGPPPQAPADLASTPDPEPRIEPIRQGGPNKPYSVLGQSYEPLSGDVAWKQRGIASWYGQKFHGRRTASGELYSVYGLTAAHRTLPIPSYVRVRHVRSGKEIIVRVNDRGPFHSSRVLDLSYAAALKLGITATGSAEVEIERITFDQIRTGAWRRGPLGTPAEEQDPVLAAASRNRSASFASATAGGAQEPPAVNAASPLRAAGEDAVSGVSSSTAPPPFPPAALRPAPDVSEPGSADRAYTRLAQGYWVQLAALGKREGVDRLQQRVNSELASLTPLMAVFQESALFRLQVGPYESREQAQGVARTVREVLALNPMVVERR